MQPSRELSRLVEIMARLRDPKTGCPWDIEQDFSTIRNYTIEEAYEVADAIERQDYDDLRDELGDLLLQPVYHAQMASELGLFDLGDVIEAITTKMIRRHPHVFGPDAANDAAAAKGRWDAIKAEERARRAARRPSDTTPPSLLDDVPQVLPALARAEKLARRAASVGFDWPTTAAVLDKADEEFGELGRGHARLHGRDDKAAIAEELGDLLFAVANLARHLGIEPEAALRDANAKFTRRFAYVEARAREDGVALGGCRKQRLDGYWNEVRAARIRHRSREPGHIGRPAGATGRHAGLAPALIFALANSSIPGFGVRGCWSSRTFAAAFSRPAAAPDRPGSRPGGARSGAAGSTPRRWCRSCR